MNHAGTGTPTHIGRNSLTDDDLRVRADGRAGGTGGNGGGTLAVPCPACGLRYTPASMRPLPRFAASAFDDHTPICPVCYHFATRPGMTVRDGLRWVGVLPVLEWALLLAGVSLIAFAVARWIGGGA